MQKDNKSERIANQGQCVRIYRVWQGHKDLNPEPTVLETAALPIELYPYVVGLRGLEPRTDRL